MSFASHQSLDYFVGGKYKKDVLHGGWADGKGEERRRKSPTDFLGCNGINLVAIDFVSVETMRYHRSIGLSIQSIW